MASRKISTNNGFSLIETIIALAIFSGIAGVAFAGTITDYQKHTARDDKTALIRALHATRSRAQAGVCAGTCSASSDHGIHFESDRYVIFQGSIFDSTDPRNTIIELNPTVALSGITDVVFERISGNAKTSPTTEQKIFLNGNTMSVITLYSEGGIDID